MIWRHKSLLRAKGCEARYYEFNFGHSDDEFQTLATELLALVGAGRVKTNVKRNRFLNEKGLQ